MAGYPAGKGLHCQQQQAQPLSLENLRLMAVDELGTVAGSIVATQKLRLTAADEPGAVTANKLTRTASCCG